MHVDTVFLTCPLIFAALWRGVQAVSPVPSVPDRVQALVGSCVVIPCSFTPLAPRPFRGRKERVDVRLRFRGGGHFFPLRSTAFNSEDRDQVSRDFQGRTSLFGRIADGDCSVKIERIRQDDPQVFEIALKTGDDLLWGKPSSFNLDVIESPEAPVISGMLSATEGQLVTLNCSVSYHCPSRPPALQWRWERGAQMNNTEPEEAQIIRLEPQRLTLLASLSFTVSHQVKPRLRCEVSYPGAKTLATSKDLHVTYKPLILRLSSTCVVEDLGLLCSCSVDSNPKPAVTWSVNGTVPPHDYNLSVTSEPNMLTATLRGHMDKPQRVICFAVNALGNDSLVLLQGEEEAAILLWLIVPAVAICLAVPLLSLLVYCCRKRAGKRVLSRRPAVYPGGLGIYQDRMPLYINCTEVTHIYTNGSYQLVYQNCTPLFVHTKQIRPMGRRGGERRRGGEGGGMDRRAGLGVRGVREVQGATDADTAIYLEIL
uniref:Ig-like domain-containing protein n=1 Tax=Amphiprion ocellaris TaxID=80972 RepID=A0AAQ5XUU5_AMPOC